MKWRRCLLFALPLVVGTGLGFLLGSVVFAGGEGPGSASDPLVARSYVDERVKGYVRELEERVAALNERALKLEEELAELQKRYESAPGQPGGGSDGGSGGSASAPGSGVVYIKEGNSYVNLRSGPGTNHEIVGKALPGQPLTVVGREGDWYRVRLGDGMTAWIAAWLVTAPS